MTLTLTLPSETEAILRERTAAAGKDVSTFVREAVEDKLAASSSAVTGRPPRSAAQWVAEFDAWIAGHKPIGHAVDDSRESIYAGRGE